MHELFNLKLVPIHQYFYTLKASTGWFWPERSYIQLLPSTHQTTAYWSKFYWIYRKEPNLWKLGLAHLINFLTNFLYSYSSISCGHLSRDGNRTAYCIGVTPSLLGSVGLVGDLIMSQILNIQSRFIFKQSQIPIYKGERNWEINWLARVLIVNKIRINLVIHQVSSEIFFIY